MIKVDDNVPLPAGRFSKYRLALMEVGQSALFPEGNQNSLAASASRHGRDNNKRFTVRKTQEGIRVWRTA